jgi:hypothetical protein
MTPRVAAASSYPGALRIYLTSEFSGPGQRGGQTLEEAFAQMVGAAPAGAVMVRIDRAASDRHPASDIRGREAAWLIVVAPYTAAVTIAFTALSGQHAAWPWVLAILPAVLGGAAGLAPFMSMVSVQPSGAAMAAYLGRRAVTRLHHQQVRILRGLADAAR